MFEGVCGKPVGLAAMPAIAIAREAGVVPVRCVAPMSHRTQEAVSAFAAADSPAQQIIAGVAAAFPRRICPGSERRLRGIEVALADGGDVRSLMRRAAELFPSDVYRIAEDVKDGDGAPWSAGSCLMTVAVQPVGNSPGSQFLGDIEVEDRSHRQRFTLVRFQHRNSRVIAIAVWIGATEPSTRSRLALHAGDHAVDQSGAFELSKDAKHLDHHSACRRTRVAGLRSRAENNM